MSVIVSLAIGLAIGGSRNHALTFSPGAAGALLGGVLVPALLRGSSFGAAVIGTVPGFAAVMSLWAWRGPVRV